MSRKPTPKSNPRKRSDGELYARPVPNPFGQNWKEGFTDGYDQAGIRPGSDKEYRDGYLTGTEQRLFDLEEVDRSVSSN